MAKKNSFFVRLCYGYVGRYKDTSNMTTEEVIEEFLKNKGVSSPKEFFEKKFKRNNNGEQEGTNSITNKAKVSEGLIEECKKNTM